MKINKKMTALIEMILVFPAVAFMAALIVRSVQPTQYEPARSAQRLVDWFSVRPILALDVFLIAMPVLAFLIGCAWVLEGWYNDEKLRKAALEMIALVRTHASALVVAGATLVAGGILGIVALHLITD